MITHSIIPKSALVFWKQIFSFFAGIEDTYIDKCVNTTEKKNIRCQWLTRTYISKLSMCPPYYRNKCLNQCH
jgi:hypothetical protein